MADDAKLEPGWLMRTCHEAEIRSMCDHHPAFFKHLNFELRPVSDADAAELYNMMAARFEAWTGRSLKAFEDQQNRQEE